jgi:hypothetical protein
VSTAEARIRCKPAILGCIQPTLSLSTPSSFLIFSFPFFSHTIAHIIHNLNLDPTAICRAGALLARPTLASGACPSTESLMKIFSSSSSFNPHFASLPEEQTYPVQLRPSSRVNILAIISHSTYRS